MLCHNLVHLPYPFAPCVTSQSPSDMSCAFCTFLVLQPLRFTHSASLSNKTTHYVRLKATTDMGTQLCVLSYTLKRFTKM